MICNFDELNFQILQIDTHNYSKGSYNVKGRPFASLSFRLEGNCVFDIDNKEFIILPNDMLFLPAYTPYKVDYSVGKAIVIHMNNCNYDKAEKLSVSGQAGLRLLFNQLSDEWNATHSVNGAKATIYRILEIIETDRKQIGADDILSFCTSLMEENFYDPTLTVESICSAASVSRSVLQRLFNRYYSLSPKQYLLRLRMNKATGLLIENALSVKEIAFSCGFSDEKYFSRAFKERYGYPPSWLQKDDIQNKPL